MAIWFYCCFRLYSYCVWRWRRVTSLVKLVMLLVFQKKGSFWTIISSFSNVFEIFWINFKLATREQGGSKELARITKPIGDKCLERRRSHIRASQVSSFFSLLYRTYSSIWDLKRPASTKEKTKKNVVWREIRKKPYWYYWMFVQIKRILFQK